MQRDKEADSPRLDTLDLLIRILREHEKNLDELVSRLEIVLERLEDTLPQGDEDDKE